MSPCVTIEECNKIRVTAIRHIDHFEEDIERSYEQRGAPCVRHVENNGHRMN